MPIRYYNRKKKVYRKKKSYRKRYTRRRAALGQKSLKVMRWSSADTTNNCHFQFTGNDLVPSTDNATYFQLGNVVASGELVSLFDNYRINKVLYRWVCTRNPDQVTTTANKGVYPRIVWTHDFNDSAIISRNVIYQRANMKEIFMGDNYQKSKWYSLRPAILAQMYESGSTTSYSPKWRQWIDTNDTAPHYGIKYSIDGAYSGMNVRMEAKIFIECKGIS